MAERILVVADGPGPESLDAVLAGAGFDVQAAGAGAALASARATRPDVVVLDASGGALDGPAVCRALRADPATTALGVILVGAERDLDRRVAALDAGADDYLVQPVEPAELVARLRAALRRSRDLRASPITGLPGPFDLDRTMRAVLDDVDAAFALLLADLDHFGPYNARHGYDRGDAAIAATGRLLAEVLAGEAGTPRFLAHLGGDGFAVVLDPHAVAGFCDEAVAAFAAAAPLLHDPEDAERGWMEVVGRRGGQHRFPLLSLSIGVASNFLRPITSPAQAIALAGEMRAVAKTVVGSAWRVDRRRS